MNRWLVWTGAAIAGLVAAVVMVGLLNPLPSLAGREATRAVAPDENGAVGTTIKQEIARQPGQSGLRLLPDGREAFATRMLLARAAERSIDAQYYIWHDDRTGGLLFDELRAAADRGVRVRLLLDDNNTAGLDPLLARLNAHPNVELRLFNPFTVRSPRLLGWAVDFSRLNRRMHNKSFTIDNAVTVIGGRNIGDEYFGAGGGALFVDLDTLAVGPVVQDTSRDFDAYWNSASAYPAERILDPDARQRPVDRADRSTPIARQYLKALRETGVVQQLAEGSLELTWAPVTLVSDDPGKALGRAKRSDLLITQLEQVLGVPRERLVLVSGYFVPTDAFVDKLGRAASRGAMVQVVTNAFEAADVPVVHSGYAGDRKPLLRAGVRLWELKKEAGGNAVSRNRNALRSGVGGSGGWSGSGTGSTSGVPQGAGQALHAKTFTVDGKRLFVGSFNLDPRSARLNTELGFVIDSPALTGFVDARLREALPGSAYQVRLNKKGDLEWVEQQGENTMVHRTEPGTTQWSRLVISVVSILPVEWLL